MSRTVRLPSFHATTEPFGAHEVETVVGWRMRECIGRGHLVVYACGQGAVRCATCGLGEHDSPPPMGVPSAGDPVRPPPAPSNGVPVAIARRGARAPRLWRLRRAIRKVPEPSWISTMCAAAAFVIAASGGPMSGTVVALVLSALLWLQGPA